MPDTLRNSRKRRYFEIDNSFFDAGFSETLSPYAISVYFYLARCANNKNDIAFPAYKGIAQKCGMSERKAIDAVKELVNAHLIGVTRRRTEGHLDTSNLYDLLDISDCTKDSKVCTVCIPGVHVVHTGGACGAYKKEQLKEEIYINNLIENEIENSPNAISENQQPHEVGKMNNTQDANRGPKGRPLNPRFELYRAYCECRGEDVNIEIGRDMKLRQFSKEFIRTMTPEDVRSLYNYVYNKWLRAALSQGNNTLHSLPTMTHLKKDMAEWRASIANPRNVPETATGAKQFIQQENVVHDDAWKMRTRRTKLRIFENLYNDGLRTLDDLIDEGLTLDDWNAYIEDKE